MVNHNLMWRVAVFAVAALGVVCLSFAPPARAAALEGTAHVIDGDTLDLAGVRIRLFGIDAPEHNQKCTDTKGRKWACGTRATQSLAALAAGNVICEAVEQDRYGRTVARCFSGAQDIGAQMVAQGAAFAYRKYATDYVALEARAEQRGLGLWSGEAERPAEFRKNEAATHAAFQPSAPADCAIKGNISKAGRIYHVPGQKFYAKTTISESKGEHWFCSEAQAVAAGWRAARQ